jgi:hypothetical protein
MDNLGDFFDETHDNQFLDADKLVCECHLIELLFGTAGVPNNTVKKNNPVEGVQKIHELGLDCMQLEFAHGVRMKEEVSSALRKVSYELNVFH